MAEGVRNYQLCEELTAEMGDLSKQCQVLESEQQQLVKKEKQSKSYYRRKAKQQNTGTCSSTSESESAISGNAKQVPRGQTQLAFRRISPVSTAANVMEDPDHSTRECTPSSSIPTSSSIDSPPECSVTSPPTPLGSSSCRNSKHYLRQSRSSCSEDRKSSGNDTMVLEDSDGVDVCTPEDRPTVRSSNECTPAAPPVPPLTRQDQQRVF